MKIETKEQILSCLPFSKSMRPFFMVCLLFSAPFRLYAETTTGYAGDYLQYGAGARSLAMGGAFTAVADDASAEYWNPAAVAFAEEYQFLTMYAPFGLDSNLYYASVAFPMGPWGGLSASDVMLRSGGFQSRNDLNQAVGDGQSILHNAVSATYALPIKGLVSVGVKAKFLRQEVFSVSGDALGLDLGFYSRPVMGVSSGLSISQVNRPKITLREDPDVFRRNIRLGLAYRGRNDLFLVAVDVNKQEDQGAYYTSGLEVNPHPLLSLRGGWNQQNLVTAGVGLNFKYFKVDYAFSNSKDLGVDNKMSLTYRWGNVYRAKLSPQNVTEGAEAIYLEGLYNEVKFQTDVPGFKIKRWSMTIFDEEKQMVRELRGESRPPDKILWDVKDAGGKPAKRGKYHYTLKVQYKNDKVWIEKGRFKLDYRSEGAPNVEIQMRGEDEMSAPSAPAPTQAPEPAPALPAQEPAPDTDQEPPTPAPHDTAPEQP
jgi:hypothetical protein